MKKNEVKIDYDNMDKKERYEVVHAVIDKIILRRNSRYILECEIYNKMDSNISRIRIDTYNKKIIEKV